MHSTDLMLNYSLNLLKSVQLIALYGIKQICIIPKDTIKWYDIIEEKYDIVY